MTEPHSDGVNPDSEDHQEREELKPTCEGMADIPGPIEEDGQEDEDISPSEKRTR